MTSCPGIQRVSSFCAEDSNDLKRHLQHIRKWGAHCLVTLLEVDELHYYGVPDLIRETELLGLTHHHLPIIDMSVPDQRFETDWVGIGAELRRDLLQGQKVVLHCYAGMGRTGTVAARILVEFGIEPEQAMLEVRTARPGTIQTWTQENYIRQCEPLTIESVK